MLYNWLFESSNDHKCLCCFMFKARTTHVLQTYKWYNFLFFIRNIPPDNSYYQIKSKTPVSEIVLLSTIRNKTSTGMDSINYRASVFPVQQSQFLPDSAPGQLCPAAREESRCVSVRSAKKKIKSVHRIINLQPPPRELLTAWNDGIIGIQSWEN